MTNSEDVFWNHKIQLKKDMMRFWSKDLVVFEHRLDRYLEFIEDDLPVKRPKLVKNNWGFSEAEGFVFLTLMCGIGGSRIDTAIGRSSGEEPINFKTIIPLTEEDRKEAIEKKIPHLSGSACVILKRTDPSKFEELQTFGLV